MHRLYTFLNCTWHHFILALFKIAMNEKNTVVSCLWSSTCCKIRTAKCFPHIKSSFKTLSTQGRECLWSVFCLVKCHNYFHKPIAHINHQLKASSSPQNYKLQYTYRIQYYSICFGTHTLMQNQLPVYLCRLTVELMCLLTFDTSPFPHVLITFLQSLAVLRLFYQHSHFLCPAPAASKVVWSKY